jgi:hypothetical protein
VPISSTQISSVIGELINSELALKKNGDHLLIKINKGNAHWVGAHVVRTGDKQYKVFYMDSLHRKGKDFNPKESSIPQLLRGQFETIFEGAKIEFEDFEHYFEQGKNVACGAYTLENLENSFLFYNDSLAEELERPSELELRARHMKALGPEFQQKQLRNVVNVNYNKYINNLNNFLTQEEDSEVQNIVAIIESLESEDAKNLLNQAFKYEENEVYSNYYNRLRKAFNDVYKSADLKKEDRDKLLTLAHYIAAVKVEVGGDDSIILGKFTVGNMVISQVGDRLNEVESTVKIESQEDITDQEATLSNGITVMDKLLTGDNKEKELAALNDLATQYRGTGSYKGIVGKANGIVQKGKKHDGKIDHDRQNDMQSLINLLAHNQEVKLSERRNKLTPASPHDGIGAEGIFTFGQGMLINKVFAKSPAANVGLHDGDVIVGVWYGDQQFDLTQAEEADALALIRGKCGQPIKLDILRGGNPQILGEGVKTVKRTLIDPEFRTVYSYAERAKIKQAFREKLDELGDNAFGEEADFNRINAALASLKAIYTNERTGKKYDGVNNKEDVKALRKSFKEKLKEMIKDGPGDEATFVELVKASFDKRTNSPGGDGRSQ